MHPAAEDTRPQLLVCATTKSTRVQMLYCNAGNVQCRHRAMQAMFTAGNVQCRQRSMQATSNAGNVQCRQPEERSFRKAHLEAEDTRPVVFDLCNDEAPPLTLRHRPWWGAIHRAVILCQPMRQQVVRHHAQLRRALNWCATPGAFTLFTQFRLTRLTRSIVRGLLGLRGGRDPAAVG